MNASAYKLLSSGFGIGYTPLIPGTMGSLWGILIFYLLQNQPSQIVALVALALTIISIPIAHGGEKAFGNKDCRRIVVDEVAGQLIAYSFVSFDLFNVVVGFVLFRFFDVTKIYPANWAQDNIPGGAGITADDAIAGLQAGLVLLGLNYLRVKFSWPV